MFSLFFFNFWLIPFGWLAVLANMMCARNGSLNLYLHLY